MLSSSFSFISEIVIAHNTGQKANTHVFQKLHATVHHIYHHTQIVKASSVATENAKPIYQNAHLNNLTHKVKFVDHLAFSFGLTQRDDLGYCERKA